MIVTASNEECKKEQYFDFVWREKVSVVLNQQERKDYSQRFKMLIYRRYTIGVSLLVICIPPVLLADLYTSKDVKHVKQKFLDGLHLKILASQVNGISLFAYRCKCLIKTQL